MGGSLEIVKVAVARVLCIWRGSAAVGGATGYFCCPLVLGTFSAWIAVKHEKNRVFEHPQIRPPVGTLARGVKITQLVVSHAMRASVPRRIQRASPIPPRQGGRSAEVEERRQRAGYGRDGGRMEMSLWLEFRACLCARCAPDSSHSSILKKHGDLENVLFIEEH